MPVRMLTTLEDPMAKKDTSPAKTAAKGAAVYYGVKKLLKGVFLAGAVAAVAKVLRGNKAT
ncbi:MAG TPA: hypothetical protein VM307_10745 [Egibacteraceae bacterium]|nr:hypothetical protein [Egibacteraceae bacterium]